MSIKRIPFIPMSPSSLPHRRGHDVVTLPEFPNSFDPRDAVKTAEGDGC